MAEQTSIVERLRADGLDADEAERLLTNHKDVLAAFRERRSMIIDAVGKIDAGLI